MWFGLPWLPLVCEKGFEKLYTLHSSREGRESVGFRLKTATEPNKLKMLKVFIRPKCSIVLKSPPSIRYTLHSYGMKESNLKDCTRFHTCIFSVRIFHDCHTFETWKLFLLIHFLSSCTSLINSCWISGGNALKSSESMFISLGSWNVSCLEAKKKVINGKKPKPLENSIDRLMSCDLETTTRTSNVHIYWTVGKS